MDKLQQFVFDALTLKTASLVIGYEKGTGNKPRPAFFRNPADCGRLIVNAECKHNLATYLKKKRPFQTGKIGIISTLPVLKSIIQLEKENQVCISDLLVIFCRNNEEFEVLNDSQTIIDYITSSESAIINNDNELIDQLLKLPIEKRFEYWTDQLSKCIKCYACRAACPLCYCSRCSVEINQPQWVHVPSHVLGNFEWHIMRAMHMAGRCVNCNACASACPLDIPLNLLNQFIIHDVHLKFGEDIKGNLLSTYTPDDKDNLIK